MRHDWPQRRRLQQLNLVLLAGFGLVALALVYWSAWRAPALQAREDNPRLVEAELRIVRGPILDSDGQTLAETTVVDGRARRRYPRPDIGPAVGYYSFRHGTAGVEAGLDSLLRGEPRSGFEALWRQWLHQPQQGLGVRLTLRADWQRRAVDLMEGAPGAVVMLSLPDGAVRVMASQPGYDPNLLDEAFDELSVDPAAPLLNRVTQGLYQPGLVLQPFLLATAWDEGLVRLNAPLVELDRPVMVEQYAIECAAPPPAASGTWADALHFACPAPVARLGEQLGRSIIATAWQAFGFLSAPELPLATAVAPAAEAGALNVDDPALAALGQETLTVSPLQVALALAALANQGARPQPQIVAAVQAVDEAWTPRGSRPPVPAVSPDAARAIVGALRRQGGHAEHQALVLSGPEGSTNSWYLALAPAQDPRLALVVVLENTATLGPAAQLGRELLAQVMFPNQ